MRIFVKLLVTIGVLIGFTVSAEAAGAIKGVRANYSEDGERVNSTWKMSDFSVERDENTRVSVTVQVDSALQNTASCTFTRTDGSTYTDSSVYHDTSEDIYMLYMYGGADDDDPDGSIICKVDPGGVSGYTRETLTITVNSAVPAAPDLVITDAEIDGSSSVSSSYEVGERIDLSCRIENIGPGDAGRTELEYYISERKNNTYHIYADYIGDDSVSSIDSGRKSSTESKSYTLTTDDIGTRYIVFVADADEGESETEEDNNTSSLGPFTVVPRTPTPPYKPEHSSPGDGEGGVSTSPVQLRWQEAALADSYDVYFGDNSNPPLVEELTTEILWTTPTLSYGTAYYWMVVAKNDDGSTESDIWQFNTTYGTAGKITNPVPGNNEVECPLNQDLEWTSGGGQTVGYKVYFGTTSGSLDLLDDECVNTSYSLPNLEYETDYYWRIDSYNGNDIVVRGDEWHFKTKVRPEAPTEMPVRLTPDYLNSYSLMLETNDIGETREFSSVWFPQGLAQYQANIVYSGALGYDDLILKPFEDRVELYMSVIRLAITEADTQGLNVEEKFSFLGVDLSSDDSKEVLGKMETALGFVEVGYDQAASVSAIKYANIPFEVAGKFRAVADKVGAIGSSLSVLSACVSGFEAGQNLGQLSAYSVFYLALDAEVCKKKLEWLSDHIPESYDPALKKAFQLLEKEFSGYEDANYWNAVVEDYENNMWDAGGNLVDIGLTLASLVASHSAKFAHNPAVAVVAITAKTIKLQIGSIFALAERYENLRKASLAATLYYEHIKNMVYDSEVETDMLHYFQGRLQAAYFFFASKGIKDTWFNDHGEIIAHFETQHFQLLQIIENEKETWGNSPGTTSVPERYKVSALSSNGGSISPSGLISVGHGQSVEFTASSDDNYALDKWYLDGVPLSETGPVLSLSNITNNHLVKAQFESTIVTPTLGLDVNGDGQVLTNDLILLFRKVNLVDEYELDLVPSGMVLPEGTVVGDILNRLQALQDEGLLDVNEDGSVLTNDLILIFRKINLVDEYGLELLPAGMTLPSGVTEEQVNDNIESIMP